MTGASATFPRQTQALSLSPPTAGGHEFYSPAVAARSAAVPLALYQNVPNPFNPQTIIEFSLPAAVHVHLDIFDLRGCRVRRLVDEPLPAGRSAVEWDGRNDAGASVSSGVYFYRLTAGKHSVAKKMIVLK